MVSGRSNCLPISLGIWRPECIHHPRSKGSADRRGMGNGGTDRPYGHHDKPDEISHEVLPVLIGDGANMRFRCRGRRSQCQPNYFCRKLHRTQPAGVGAHRTPVIQDVKELTKAIRFSQTARQQEHPNAPTPPTGVSTNIINRKIDACPYFAFSVFFLSCLGFLTSFFRTLLPLPISHILEFVRLRPRPNRAAATDEPVPRHPSP